ncbi:hypothetical protein ACLB2K_048622 [Fragaria x ananassa]
MVLGSDGILSEARWLLDVGLLPNSHSATRAIGYRQVVTLNIFQAMEYLLLCREQGGSSSPREFYNFLTQFQKASRNFAKRQLTWFRNEHIYHWLDASKPLDDIGDKSVFIFQSLPEDEKKALVKKLEQQEYSQNPN